MSKRRSAIVPSWSEWRVTRFPTREAVKLTAEQNFPSGVPAFLLCERVGVTV